jgi:plastocyanin
MSRLSRLPAILTVAVAAAALTGSAAAHHPQATALKGSVGPGFTISLSKGGAKVSKLKAGAYTITVSDKSSSHNFHLTGPGVNKKTDVAGTGTKSWTVTLRKGTYKFVCDPHASMMKGSFTVS